MAIISVVSQKGGVGKTTLTAQLTGELIMLGVSVVTFDADTNQDSLDLWKQEGSMLRGFIRSIPDNEKKMVEEITEAEKWASVVLIDCPPSISELATSAVALSDYAVIPCGHSTLDFRGTYNTLKFIAQIQNLKKGKPKGLLVPYRLEPSTLLSQVLSERLRDLIKEVIKETKAEAKSFLLMPGINRTVEVEKAARVGKTVLEHNPNLAVRAQYRELARRIVKLGEKT